MLKYISRFGEFQNKVSIYYKENLVIKEIKGTVSVFSGKNPFKSCPIHNGTLKSFVKSSMN